MRKHYPQSNFERYFCMTVILNPVLIYPTLFMFARTHVSLSRFSSYFVSTKQTNRFPLLHCCYVAEQPYRRGWRAWKYLWVPRTCASPGPLECHPGDGPGMKPIFDGVYINQILFRAGTVSIATLDPDKFSPSDARPGSPAPFVRSSNGPLKPS